MNVQRRIFACHKKFKISYLMLLFFQKKKQVNKQSTPMRAAHALHARMYANTYCTCKCTLARAARATHGYLSVNNSVYK